MMLARKAKTQARTANKKTIQPTKKPLAKESSKWLYDGSLKSVLLGFIVLLFKRKTGLFGLFFAISPCFMRIFTCFAYALFGTRNLGLLMVNQQGFGTVGDGALVD